MAVQRDFVLRIPADESGYNFISELQKYLNTDTYKMGPLRFSGKRKTAFRGHTRKEDADSIKIYIKDRRVKGQVEYREATKLEAREKAKTIRHLAQAIIDIQETVNEE